MGSTFSNISIRKNSFLTQEIVAESLSTILMDRGFIRSAKDSADISFAVFSLPSSQWFTVCENGMLFDDFNEQLDIANLLSAKLNSDVLRISCFDSDYIYLNLLNPQKKLDAWASVGNSTGLGIRRRTGVSAWKALVSDVSKFKQALKKQYVFAEEVLEEVSAELELPHTQSFSEFDYLADTLPSCDITYLYFSMPASHSSTEPPTLEHYTYGLMPCTSGRPTVVSCINKGGAGKGIEIFILGKSIEHYDITFTEVTLAYWNRARQQDHTPVVLEKRQMPDGSIGYYGEVRNFRIPEKVSSVLPSAVRVKKESDLHFWFRCVPQYTDTVSIKLKIIVRPIQNPDGGVEWRC